MRHFLNYFSVEIIKGRLVLVQRVEGFRPLLGLSEVYSILFSFSVLKVAEMYRSQETVKNNTNPPAVPDADDFY